MKFLIVVITWVMMACVFSARHDLKILNSIIRFIAINMMDYFKFCQRSAYMFFYNVTMFGDIFFIVSHNHYTACFESESSALPPSCKYACFSTHSVRYCLSIFFRHLFSLIPRDMICKCCAIALRRTKSSLTLFNIIWERSKVFFADNTFFYHTNSISRKVQSVH